MTAQTLDRVFWALADATRRGIVERLLKGPASVSQLAQPHGMSLTGFMKHLRVLEAAGLVLREKEGRVVRCELAAAPMQEAAMWLARYKRFWNRRFDALGPKANSSSKSKDATTRRPKAPGRPGPVRKR